MGRAMCISFLFLAFFLDCTGRKRADRETGVDASTPRYYHLLPPNAQVLSHVDISPLCSTMQMPLHILYFTFIDRG